MNPIVIVGTGLAGYTVAREFRKFDRDTPLILVTRDDGCFYSKPMLSNAFTSGKTPDTLGNADAKAMADQLRAEVRTFTAVSALDTAARTVSLDGETLDYRKLVLAIGADPIHIPVAGDAADEVMSVNDLMDYTRFRARIAGARHVTIMGAGLIGCEFANDFFAAGIRCDVVDPAAFPLSRFLPEPAGRALQEALAAFGVGWHFERTVATVGRAGEQLKVALSDGQVLHTDAVLSAVGLRPRTQLSQAAGLRVNRGVLVDRLLATSAPDVYALGDCAEVEGLVLPFIMPIMYAGRALGQTLAGKPSPVQYPAMPVLVKTTRYPVVVAPPRTGMSGDWVIESIDGGVRALYRAGDGRLEGFALLGAATAEKQKLARDLPPWLS